MMSRRARNLIAAAAPLIALALTAAPAAAASPVWSLGLHPRPTHFAPGASSRFAFDVDNVGGAATSAPIELRLHLPGGVHYESSSTDAGSPFEPWSCETLGGDDREVRCTTPGPQPRHALDRYLTVFVSVDPGASGTESASAELSGGGAPNVAQATAPLVLDPTPASFGVLPDSFTPGFFGVDEQGPEGLVPEEQAGGHPELFTVPFALTSALDAEGKPQPAGNIRDVGVDLPPGFLGAPTAAAECPLALFALEECPFASQVGRIDANLTNQFKWLTVGMFNLVHPRGYAADFGIDVGGNPVHVRASLDPAERYAIRSTVSDINETFPPFDQQVTLWGVPAAASHDSERCRAWSSGGLDEGVKDTSEECQGSTEEKAFITMPAQCEEENVFRLRGYDFWRHESQPGPEIDHALPSKMKGCEKPRFNPEVSLAPTGRQAGEPTGLDVHIEVPQQDSAVAPATPPVKSTVVTLPEGMTVNPAFADGLTGCTEAQIGLGTDEPVACPDNSRIGEVELHTPLVPGPAVGSLYLATQEANPFHSLLAFYLALHDTEQRGVLIKVAGRVDLDPHTGRITTTFSDLPQLPFSDLTLKFRSGERAPLVNPPTCGTHEIEARMASYARPAEPVDVSGAYSLSEGPEGTPCRSELSQRPFEPSLLAGTLNPVAGAFSPLLIRAFRSDADQELSSAEGVAPAGLTASLRGITRCPDSQIALAASRNRPGEGQLERRSPSCPANSEVGTVQTGAGAGPAPIYVPGKVYLAGPYEGAPLSGVAIVPAIAGPTDLGVVVVRSPAYIDPDTAQVRLKTDPLPQILHGVLIRVKDVRIRLERPRFTLNPTSCAPKSIEATLHSTEGALKQLSNRFQVSDCASLGFKPRITLKLKGGTRRGAHPSLRAVVRPREGDANISRAAVTLPHSAFLDQAHIRTICTRVQFNAGAGNGERCPPASVYGHARAFTPLLDEPLEGPVFLRSSNHNLPDVVVALHGPPSLPIDFNLDGRVDSVHGGIRNTFEAAPDAPVSKFVLTMQGGKKGLVINSTNLCAQKRRATARLTAHSNRRDNTHPVVHATGCHKASHKRHGKHSGRPKHRG